MSTTIVGAAATAVAFGQVDTDKLTVLGLNNPEKIVVLGVQSASSEAGSYLAALLGKQTGSATKICPTLSEPNRPAPIAPCGCGPASTHYSREYVDWRKHCARSGRVEPSARVLAIIHARRAIAKARRIYYQRGPLRSVYHQMVEPTTSVGLVCEDLPELVSAACFAADVPPPPGCPARAESLTDSFSSLVGSFRDMATSAVNQLRESLASAGDYAKAARLCSALRTTDWTEYYRFFVCGKLLADVYFLDVDLSSVMMAISAIMAHHGPGTAFTVGATALLYSIVSYRNRPKKAVVDDDVGSVGPCSTCGYHRDQALDEPAEAQSFFADMGGSLHGMMCSLVGVDPLQFTIKDALLENLSWDSFKKVAMASIPVAAIMRFLEMAYRWVSTFADWARNKILAAFGYPPHLKDCGDAWVASRLSEFLERGTLAIDRPVDDPFERRLELVALVATGDEYCAAFKGLNPSIQNTLALFVAKLKIALEGVERSMETGKRVEPYHVCFIGPPGTGKTTLVNTCIVPYINSVFYPEMRYDQIVYNKALGTRFWDGYSRSVKIVIVDELSASAAEGSVLSQLIELISAAPFTLNMAAIPDKGTHSFGAEFVISNSNELLPVGPLDKLGINIGAFQRRLNPVIVRWARSVVPDDIIDTASWDKPLMTDKGQNIFFPVIPKGRAIIEYLEFAWAPPGLSTLGGTPYSSGTGLAWVGHEKFLQQFDARAHAKLDRAKAEITENNSGAWLASYLGKRGITVPAACQRPVPERLVPPDLRPEVGPSSVLVSPSEFVVTDAEVGEIAAVMPGITDPAVLAEAVADVNDTSVGGGRLAWLRLTHHKTIESVRTQIALARTTVSNHWVRFALIFGGAAAAGYALYKFFGAEPGAVAESGVVRAPRRKVVVQPGTVPSWTGPRAGHPVVAGMAESAGIDSNVLAKVSKNLVTVYFESTFCTGIGLAGQWVLVPYHMFAGVEVECVVGRSLAVQLQDERRIEIPVTPEIMRTWFVSEGGDYIIFPMPKSTTFSDITNHICPHEVAMPYTGSPAGRMVLLRKGKMIQVSLDDLAKGNDDGRMRKYFESTRQYTITVPASYLWTYTAGTDSGDCGNPIFACINGSTRLVGFHALSWVGSNVRGQGAARFMPPSDLLATLTTRVKPVVESTTAVAQSGPVYVSPSDVLTVRVEPADVGLPQFIAARCDQVYTHNGPLPNTSAPTSLELTRHSRYFESDRLPAVQAPCMNLVCGELQVGLPCLGQLAEMHTVTENQEILKYKAEFEAGVSVVCAGLATVSGIRGQGRFLSPEENVFGSTGIEPTPMDTAMGWPNTGPKKMYGVLVPERERYGFSESVLASHIEFAGRFIDDTYSPYDHSAGAIFYILQKDETLNWKKVIPGLSGPALGRAISLLLDWGVDLDEIDSYINDPTADPATWHKVGTRMLCAATSETNYGLRHVFGSVYAFLRASRNCRGNPVGTGFSPVSGDIDCWMYQMTRVIGDSKRVLCLDGRRWDRKVVPFGMESVLCGLATVSSGSVEWRSAAMVAANRLSHAGLVIGEHVVHPSAGLYSGMLGTAEVGTLIFSSVVAAYVVIANPGVPYHELARGCWFKGVGDDLVACVSPELHFDLQAFAAFTVKLGLEITDSDKDQPVRWRSLEEVEICSRTVSKLYGRYVMPLKEESIYRPFVYRQKTMSNEAAFRSAVDSGVCEAALHGSEFFGRFVKRVGRVADLMGYHFDVPSYSGCWAIINKHREQLSLGMVSTELPDISSVGDELIDWVATAQSGVQGEAERLDSVGTSTLTPSIDTVPTIRGAVSRAVGAAAEQVTSRALMAVGLCRPRVDALPGRAGVGWADNLANGIGGSSCPSIGLDVNNHVEVSGTFMGGTREDNYETIERVRRIQGVFNWTSGLAKGTRVLIIPVTPMWCHMVAPGDGTYVAYPSALNIVTGLHRLWRCHSLSYVITVVKAPSAVMAGRLLIGFNTGSGAAIDETATQYLKTVVLDLSVTDEVEFVVDYVAPRSWMEVGELVGGAPGSGVYLPRCMIGTLQAVVLNPLSGATTVEILVRISVRGLELQQPTFMRFGDAGWWPLPESAADVELRAKRLEGTMARAESGTTAGHHGMTDFVEGGVVAAEETSIMQGTPAEFIPYMADPYAGLSAEVINRPIVVVTNNWLTATSTGVFWQASLPEVWRNASPPVARYTSFFRYFRIDHFVATLRPNGTINNGGRIGLVWSPFGTLVDTTGNEDRYTLSGFPMCWCGPVGETATVKIPFVAINGLLDAVHPSPSGLDEMGMLSIVVFSPLIAINAGPTSVPFTLTIEAKGVRLIGPTNEEPVPVEAGQSLERLRLNTYEMVARAESGVVPTVGVPRTMLGQRDTTVCPDMRGTERYIGGEVSSLAALLRKPVTCYVVQRGSAVDPANAGVSVAFPDTSARISNVVFDGGITHFGSDYLDLVSVVSMCFRGFSGSLEYTFLVPPIGYGGFSSAYFEASIDEPDHSLAIPDWRWTTIAPFTSTALAYRNRARSMCGRAVQRWGATDSALRVSVPFYGSQFVQCVPPTTRGNVRTAQDKQPRSVPCLRFSLVQEPGISLTANSGTWVYQVPPRFEVLRNFGDDAMFGFLINPPPIYNVAATVANRWTLFSEHYVQ